MRDWQDYMDEFATTPEEDQYPPWWFWDTADETTNRNPPPPGAPAEDESDVDGGGGIPGGVDMGWWTQYFSDWFKNRAEQGFGMTDEEKALRRVEAEDYIWSMKDKFIGEAQRDLPATGRTYGGTGSGYYADIDEAALGELQRRNTAIEQADIELEREEMWRWLQSAIQWYLAERGFDMQGAALSASQEASMRQWLLQAMGMM